MPVITIPEGTVEIARLTTRTGRVLIIAYADTDGTYGYRAEGACGTGHTLRTIVQRLNDVLREWPGGKTATFTAIASLFGNEPVGRSTIGRWG